MQSWKEILKEERDRVPAGSPFGAYAAATKRASARYRGRRNPHYVGGRGRAVQSNPRIAGMNLGTIALLGVGAAAVMSEQVRNGLKSAGDGIVKLVQGGFKPK